MKDLMSASFAIGLLAGTANAQCTNMYTQADATMNIRWTLESPAHFEPGFGLAYAFTAYSSLPIFCGNPSTCVDGDADAFSGYGSASALSTTCGRASSSVSLSSQLLTVQSHVRTVSSVSCAECGDIFNSGGSAGGIVATEISGGTYSFDIDIDTDIDCNNPSGTPATGTGGYFVSYTDTNGNPAYDIIYPWCTIPGGPACGTYTTTIPVSGGPGPLVIGTLPSARNDHWDFNGDGRVNQIDVLDVFSLVPATYSSGDPIEAYDLDNDNDVDLADLNLLGNFFSSLDQGVAGDDDGDLAVDCDDLAGVLAHQFDPALTVCDPGYRVEFDVDLDGDNDLEDREWILLKIQPADLSLDGDLDFYDVSLFTTAFGLMEEPADWDDNGIYDFFDVSGFLDDFNNISCP